MSEAPSATSAIELPSGLYGFQAGLDVLSVLTDGDSSFRKIHAIATNAGEWWITESGDCHPEILTAIESVVGGMEEQSRPVTPEQFDTYMEAACDCILQESPFLTQNRQHSDAFRYAMLHQARGVIPVSERALVTCIPQTLSAKQAEFIALCSTWRENGNSEV